MMSIRSREQKLIDYCFEFALKAGAYCQSRSADEIAAWVARNLKDCGFPTQPVGMSWGVLIKEPGTLDEFHSFREACEHLERGGRVWRYGTPLPYYQKSPEPEERIRQYWASAWNYCMYHWRGFTVEEQQSTDWILSKDPAPQAEPQQTPPA